MFDTRIRLSFFAGSQLQPTKNRLRLHRKSGGSGSATLILSYECTWKYLSLRYYFKTMVKEDGHVQVNGEARKKVFKGKWEQVVQKSTRWDQTRTRPLPDLYPPLLWIRIFYVNFLNS